MHIPDGYLGPVTYGACWAGMLPIWGYASRKVKLTVKTAEVPYLAMGTVFSLVAMMFVLPLPGGTTGHISGTTLVAILLGPWAAIVAVSVSLMIQAIVMGDGGITAIGANCFNVAVIGALCGSAIYRLIVGAATRWGEQGTTVSAVAGAVAAYLATNLGALSTAAMLGLQPLIYGDKPGSGYFPFPLEVAIPATMLPHLTMVGILEATVTALVLAFLTKKGVAVKGGAQLVALFAAALCMGAAAASAHDYWIERMGKHYAVVYGHREQRLEYDPAKVKRVTVYNAAGVQLDFKKEVRSKAMLIHPSGKACLILADLESGYWSKTIYGLKNLPKRKATRPIESFKAYHYSKSIVSAGEAALKPVEGLRLDIVPIRNPLDMKAGDTLPLKVLFDGKPYAGAPVEGDHDKIGQTDGEGTINVTLKKGRQIYTVERRDPIRNDPDADYAATTTTLTFEVNR
ncbi:cobalt transporter CbiM [Geobacter sp. DSM 9736]|uniref:cobalt transporter CbiM n=1 Tax=Geobacter sp. DSM 9736 TaxID=1277350 RepID=UPI000B50DDC4|nr:cobalt transporter CbiM [Geobacter sp. DSM 9736]SNB44813.1 cobalamin biosynthesis protein CbiM [Geobacter sp. DSM 9736]